MSTFISSTSCKVESLPIMYLGFPLGGNNKAFSFWDPLIDKFRQKLDE